MNIFAEAINNNKIDSEDSLKRLFWKLAKKLHPDANSVLSNHEDFILLKNNYDEALEALKRKSKPSIMAQSKTTTVKKRADKKVDRTACIHLFMDLMASNFPADESARAKNKIYRTRVDELNIGLEHMDNALKDVFKTFEQEMLTLKGKTTISNHPYNVVKLFFYRYCDYAYNKNNINKNYLTNGYALVKDIMENAQMTYSLIFVNWLVSDIFQGSNT